MCGLSIGNGRAALQIYHAQFSYRRMPDHRIFERLHRQLRETRSFHITRRDVCRRRVVHSSSLEESILNVLSDRPGSSTRSDDQDVSVNHQTVCGMLNENLLHLFHFQRVQACRLSSPTTSRRYSNVRCSWTS
ncbi:DUF4817 domain-containing protein [Trichonephila clavipes]|uniref:DUF4817 domain-containing protein n=1 Tax=Trichonephila clavipes TaxID=2585209 RepID=A0A8X6REQ5_TRICX|nr:DUF4817 domain-containing protein [Trichonephila clavipes]